MVVIVSLKLSYSTCIFHNRNLTLTRETEFFNTKKSIGQNLPDDISARYQEHLQGIEISLDDDVMNMHGQLFLVFGGKFTVFSVIN